MNELDLFVEDTTPEIDLDISEEVRVVIEGEIAFEKAMKEEREAREQADGELNARIDTEKDERQAVDNALQDNINAVEKLFSAFDKEVGQRFGTVEGAQTALELALQDETATRTQENTAINERIDEVEETHEADKKALNKAIEELKTDKAVVVVNVEKIIAEQDTALFLELSKKYANGEIVIVGKLGEAYGIVTAVEYSGENNTANWNVTSTVWHGGGEEVYSYDVFSAVVELLDGQLIMHINQSSLYNGDINAKIEEIDEGIESNKQSIERLKDGTDYVALATKALQDGSNNVIHLTYETKEDATAKYNELSEAVNSKVEQSDFEEIIAFIAGNMPKIVRL